MQVFMRNNDPTNLLTDIGSRRNVEVVESPAQVEKALRQRYDYATKRFQRNSAEMEKLREAWMRYRELQDDNNRLDTIKRGIIAALGEDCYKDASGDPNEQMVVVGDEPLWVAIAAIVEQRPGIQVIELERLLEAWGRKTTWQAINSALTTHKKEFDVKRRGRRNFVYLREGAYPYAASTK